jgi:hypothetical protein
LISENYDKCADLKPAKGPGMVATWEAEMEMIVV